MIKYPYIENTDNIFIENCNSIFITSASGKEFELIKVIRCKDCKFWGYKCQGDFDFIYGDCLLWVIKSNRDFYIETTGEHYCGFAERRENKC